MAAKPKAALTRAQQLISQVRASKEPLEKQQKLLDFIETVVLYQFPQKSRKELEKMLQVNDVRETKVFQEALEEGMEKGMEKGKRLGVEEAQEAFALPLFAKEYPLEEIANLTGLSLTHIKKLKKKQGI